MKKIKALLVDDEVDACDNLKELIEGFTDNDIEVAGIAYSTKDAEALIKELTPDILFLDINMHVESAFDFLARIGPVNFEIVFVTAYDQYAMKALKLNAIDYILKPVAIDELQLALNKIKSRLQLKQNYIPWKTYGDISDQISGKKSIKNICLKENNRLEIVPLELIHFIEAMGPYSKFVYTTEGFEIQNMVVCTPVSYYEDLLFPLNFYRVHKSYIVNTAQVGKVINDKQIVVLKSGEQLPVSRRRFHEFILYLKEQS
ncbi:MAG: LytTR family DNA-binding domain-containing protein [Chitinophagaceae bacterium]|jgi:two-component system LytT family response regulator